MNQCLLNTKLSKTITSLTFKKALTPGPNTTLKKDEQGYKTIN